MAVPYTFATQTTSIPLAQLDTNFSTPVTIGTTIIPLGNIAPILENVTLGNVVIASGNVTLTNVNVINATITQATITTANVTTANITSAFITTANVTTANITTANVVTIRATTANIATANVTAMEAVAANVTTLLSTTINVTTANATTAFITTANVATANVSAMEAVSANVTTILSTTANLTTANVTTAFITTANIATANVVTIIATTANIATANVTTLIVSAINVATANVTTLITAGITDSGNLAFTGTGNRITGDFSNATLANRVAFQSSTTNGGTVLTAIPNGTSALSQIQLYSNSDPTNSSRLTVFNNGTTCSINADISGTGTALPLTFQTGGSERARIDTSGNVGVGTASPAYKLDVSGVIRANSGYFRSTNTYTVFTGADILGTTGGMTSIGANPLVFGTDGTERMRIDSSGALLVGKTALNDSVAGAQIAGASSTYPGRICATVANSTSATEGIVVYSSSAVAYRFYVSMDGKVNATNTTIAAISDQRLKENIRDLDDGLSSIMVLQPRKFDWKEGKGADIKNVRGFIAQEFETVFPDLVDTWKDPAPEGEEPYKSVRADLIPTLVKAIQELKAIVDAQAVRIAALES